MLSKIDPSACDLIRSELNQALESVQEKLGVRINIGNMTYFDCDVKTSLSVELAGAEEKPMRDLKRYMSLLDTRRLRNDFYFG
jgi:mannose/fructose/N-acetylgalactosamine-specific phosphotransferase system component IIB